MSEQTRKAFSEKAKERVDSVSETKREPEFVVKFRKIDDHFKDSIENKYIWFATPETLNDPFDCQVDFRSAIQRIQQIQPRNQNLPFLNTFVSPLNTSKPTMVFSASKKIDPIILSTLMWAHYGDNHRGLIIEYNARAIINHANEILSTNLKFDEVKYCNNNHITNWLSRQAATNNLHGNSFFDGWWEKAFLTKNTPWQYEKEFRIIRSANHQTSKNFNSQAADPKLTIPFDAINRIYFGLNTPQTYINCVSMLVRKNFPDCQFHRIFRNGNSDFGLKVKQL